MIPKKIQYTLHKIFSPGTVWGTKIKISPMKNLQKLGTEYGGWVVPMDLLHEGSICYCVGAGEDISFDVLLAEKKKAEVYVIDPTPRAKSHFQELINQTTQGEKVSINQKTDQFYEISKDSLPHLHFLDIGLWKEEGTIPFYMPKNEAHVSHSLVNLQQTENYIEVKVQRLGQLMKEMGHASIDILKLDIEGAEYEVLDTLIADQLDIKILAIEFERPPEKDYVSLVKNYLEKLDKAGYAIVYADMYYNCTLVKKELL